jgi:hypothetical protein
MNAVEWTLTVANLARILLALNVFALVFGGAKLPLEIRAVQYFLVVDLLTEVAVGWMSFHKIPNMELLHIYTILELVTWSIFYKTILSTWVPFQRYFLLGLSLMVVLLIGNSLFLEPVNGFNSNAKTLVQITMIVFAVAYFFRNFGNTDFTQPRHFALAMINTAVLLYYSGSLFIFMFSKILNDPVSGVSTAAQVGFWVLNSILFLVFQLLMFIALWRVMLNRKPS